MSRSSIITKDSNMAPVAHPGRFLKREILSRGISANRLALDLGVPSGPRHGHSERAALDHRRHRGAARPLFRQQRPILAHLQSQHDIAMVEREKGSEIAKRVRPADAA